MIRFLLNRKSIEVSREEIILGVEKKSFRNSNKITACSRVEEGVWGRSREMGRFSLRRKKDAVERGGNVSSCKINIEGVAKGFSYVS